LPTYDYECSACGKTIEIFHKMSELKKTCPKCGKPALTRRIGPGSGFLFRGSGFYITDYRSPDYKSKAESDKPKAAEPAPSAEKDSKAKPSKDSKESKKASKSD
jgi:putative FmdB family regulatory protein